MAGRGGRPWGPIRAESEEAKKLAVFLRAQVDASGKTLKTLAAEIHLSKTQISERLAGKAPDQAFVTTLLRVTIPEPRLREQRLAEAARLLRAATYPSSLTPPPSAASPVELAALRARQVETYDRLTRSLEQQNQLREANANSAKLVMVLLTMINTLEQRITDLTGERDQLRAAHADTGTKQQTQQKLTRAQEQEQRAQQELQRAQDKQRQAEELAARIQAQVDHLTDELDRLRTGTPGTGPASHAPPPDPADPAGDDIDQALARAATVNDQGEQTLRRITDDLTPDVPAQQVVRDNPPDNSLSGPITAETISALETEVKAAEAARAYHTAIGLYTDLVDAYTSIYGPDDPMTLITRHSLAFCRGEAGDAVGAVEALADLLSVYERVLGPEDLDTLSTRYSLAFWRGEAGDAAGAVAEFAALLSVEERVLGPEHPSTLSTRNSLAFWRSKF